MIVLILCVSTAYSSFQVVSRIGYGGLSQVFLANSERGQVALKCDHRWVQHSALQEEFYIMDHLKAEPWSLEPIALIEDIDAPTCMAMELAGEDLFTLRSAKDTKWSIETIASIGIALLNALETLHFKYDLVHKDIFAGNIASRQDDKSKLVLIDYGKTRSSSSSYDRWFDLHQAMLCLRFLWDGDYPLYSVLDARYEVDLACEDIPEGLREAIDYVCGWDVPEDWEVLPDHYDHVRTLLAEHLPGQNTEGSILWSP